MHLAEIMALRVVPAAGLLLALTRRCPLSCAHCSTDSSAAAEQYSGASFRRLVASFSRDNHPEVIVMSGGEPLLRPRLVTDLAVRARGAGTRSCVLSGMFFARGRRPPSAAIKTALSAIDHLAASIDAYHEREVSRRDVFRCLHAAAGLVPDVSVQITGYGDDDPYVEGLVADIRAEFADKVPVLVTRLQPTGRAREWLPSRGSRAAAGADVMPCDLAAWPMAHYDGTVFACCRQSLLQAAMPGHLVLGHAATDSWPQLRQRCVTDPVLRAIRLAGPVYTRRRFGTGSRDAGGACATCVTMASDEGLASRAASYLGSPAGQAVEMLARSAIERGQPQRFVSTWASHRYRDLVSLGQREPSIELQARPEAPGKRADRPPCGN